MKRKISFLLIILIILSVPVLLSGCGASKVNVESLLKIDSSFKGTREITFEFPNDIDTGNLEDKLKTNCPKGKNNDYTIKTTTILTGKKISFIINFENQNDYINKVANLLGRDVAVYMAQPNSILTKGTRIEENFDVKEITNWFTDIVRNNEQTKNVEFAYVSNLVNVNGVIFTTDTTINVNDVSGYEVNEINIETTNNKNGTFERRFTFVIPEKTYTGLGDKIKQFFKNNTDNAASFSDWVQKGSTYEYDVIYKDIDSDMLSLVTNKILNVNDCSVYYGDKTNSSTPLSEGLVFEEKLDLFSFIGKDKKPVKTVYKYYLPTTTTHGEGLVLKNGAWQTAGQWSDASYSLDIDCNVMNIHIPDGIQYLIEGININLENQGENIYKRTTDILYSKTDGQNALQYGYNFFNNKSADVSKTENNNYLICRVETKGTAQQINAQSTKLFGGGNTVSCVTKGGFIDVTSKKEFIDNINFGYMLTPENAKKPITYTVKANKDETIRSVRCGGVLDSSAYKSTSDNGDFTVKISGITTVETLTGKPNISGIVFYSILSFGLISLAICFIILLNKKPRKDEHEKSHAPTQTTTFYISDIISLKEGMNWGNDNKKDK